MSIESVRPSSHLILCCPLLLLSPIPPSIRVFSNESALRIRWPKYWSFSFRISPSNEHPRLISFRMDWLDLLAVQGTLKNLLQHHSSKASILWCSAFFTVQLSYKWFIIMLLFSTCSSHSFRKPQVNLVPTMLLRKLKWRKSCSGFSSRRAGFWPAPDLLRHCPDSMPAPNHSKSGSALDKVVGLGILEPLGAWPASYPASTELHFCTQTDDPILWPGIISRSPQTAIWSLTCGVDTLPGTPFPTGTLDCCHS